MVKDPRDSTTPTFDESEALFSMDPAAVSWRSEQAHVDADIEGLPRDAGADALVAEMDKLDLTTDERLERLKIFFRAKSSAALAAE